MDERKQPYFVYHLYHVSSATYHQNYCYNGSTIFTLISYKISISEIQDQQAVPRYSHIPPDCYVAKQCTTISIFPVSPIHCIGCNRSNSRHLATELVDMWSLKNQEINITKGTRVDYIQVRNLFSNYPLLPMRLLCSMDTGESVPTAAW